MKLRSQCRCACHLEGSLVRHIMPCCRPDPETSPFTFTEEWFRKAVQLELEAGVNVAAGRPERLDAVTADRLCRLVLCGEDDRERLHRHRAELRVWATTVKRDLEAEMTRILWAEMAATVQVFTHDIPTVVCSSCSALHLDLGEPCARCGHTDPIRTQP